MKSKIMPPAVLTVICVAVCSLLVLAHNMTYVDNTGVLTDEMKKGCEEIFGEGSYEIVTEKKDHDTVPVDFGVKQINSVITDRKNRRCIFELTWDGYAKGGLHLMIGINDEGRIEGLYFLSVGETPGLGAKVAQKDYYEKFSGLSVESDIEAVDNMTAATYSSKGLKEACEKALEIYTVHKGELLDE